MTSFCFLKLVYHKCREKSKRFVFEDIGNLNEANSLTIALFVYPIIRALADVTVEGEGGVDARRFGSGYAFTVGNEDTAGALTIKSGSHFGTTSVTKGDLNISGGYFEADPYGVYGRRYTLNCIDANYNDGSARISLTGGTYVGFDPVDCDVEGEGTNFCAEYHVSVDNGNDTWTVVDAVTAGYVAYNVHDDLYFDDLSDALSFGVVMDSRTEVGGIEIDWDTARAFTKDMNGKAMTITVTGVNKLGSGAYIYAAPVVGTVAEVTATAQKLICNIP